MRLRKSQKGRYGFSLIETMVASVVLVAVILGAASMIHHTTSGIYVEGGNRIVYDAVNELLEQARADGYFKLGGFSTNLVINGDNLPCQVDVIDLYNPVMTNLNMREVVVRTNYRGTDIMVRSLMSPEYGVWEGEL